MGVAVPVWCNGRGSVMMEEDGGAMKETQWLVHGGAEGGDVGWSC